MSSEKMRAHTPDYKKQNDLAEQSIAKAERDKVLALLSQVREFAVMISPRDTKYFDAKTDRIRSAIEKLADAIERVAGA